MQTKQTIKLARFVMFISFIALMFISGCARYARNVNVLYEPTTTLRGVGGDLYVVIPESQITPSSEIKWVLGKVLDDENNKIDEVLSPRSPAEIMQSAFSQEFKKTGYTVIPVTKRPEAEQRVIELTKTEIEMEQISDLSSIKAKCRLLVGLDVLKNGQLIKRLQYESISSKTDIKDRDLLAGSVLQDALQSVMLKAIPEINTLFKP